MKTSWRIRIQDPSGETRVLPVALHPKTHAVLGRDGDSTILLRDPTVARQAALLWSDPGAEPGEDGSPFWLRAAEGAAPLRLGDLVVREARLPTGLPVALGETRLTLERSQDLVSQLPEQPPGTRPWLTCSEAGRELLWTARKAAATPLATYLEGETGTGKEVLAHLIHGWSERAAGPFVPLH
jgi:hypothetical protein